MKISIEIACTVLSFFSQTLLEDVEEVRLVCIFRDFIIIFVDINILIINLVKIETLSRIH